MVMSLGYGMLMGLSREMWGGGEIFFAYGGDNLTTTLILSNYGHFTQLSITPIYSQLPPSDFNTDD